MKDFEMSSAQLSELKEAINSPLIAIHCANHRSVQELANDAWKALGCVMGFDHMTVEPNGQGERFFSAVSTKECEGIEIGDGNFSGCDQSAGDCPKCGK